MCGCGEIGRRVWFRSIWGQLLGGSSPFTRTKNLTRFNTKGIFGKRGRNNPASFIYIRQKSERNKFRRLFA
jgi:hypothetical protein